MPRVPIDHRSCLGQDGSLGPGDQRGKGADIDVLDRLVGRLVGACRIEREMSATLGDAEESKSRPRRDYLPPRADRLPVKRHLAAVADRRLQIPEGD